MKRAQMSVNSPKITEKPVFSSIFGIEVASLR